MTDEIVSITRRLLPESTEGPEIIVSLTSHGKRVADNAPFAIVSILHQSILPNRIILNLDKNAWNEDTIPSLLKKLVIAGLEICFCEDIGPHTKLLPTLERHPDSIIITVDDDIFYESNLIADLMHGYHHSDHQTIICREAKVIEKTDDGSFVSYSQARSAEPGTTSVGYIPYGFRGVLYPPKVFPTKDIFDKVFRAICKNADDIWFGVTEYKESIPVYCVASDNITLDFIDTVEQYNPTSGDCLYYDNSLHGKNDIQFQAALKHYSLS